MAILKKNDKGVTAINNELLRTVIIEDIKQIDLLVLCNKKGVPVKKTFFGGAEDIRNAVNIRDNKEDLRISIYLLSRNEECIDNICDEVICNVFKLLDTICVHRKCTVIVNVKGIVTKDNEVLDRDIEISRTYEHA